MFIFAFFSITFVFGTVLDFFLNSQKRTNIKRRILKKKKKKKFGVTGLNQK